MSVTGASTGQEQVEFNGLTDIIDQVVDTAQTEKVSLHDVIDAIGSASFAPVLLLPAVAVTTPLSGIPLFSAMMGVLIALVSAQMLFRRDHLWLPDWILRRKVKGEKVVKAFEYVRPAARWLDRHTGKRLRYVVKRPLIFLPQLACLLSGLAMPMLELVPFSSSIMGAGVTLLALGMLTRDGLLVLIGLIPYGIVGYLIATVGFGG